MQRDFVRAESNAISTLRPDGSPIIYTWFPSINICSFPRNIRGKIAAPSTFQKSRSDPLTLIPKIRERMHHFPRIGPKSPNT
ncbi:MAG: hypothetical protein WEB58_14035, partial [Planctomycetaceae bacterium]